MTKTGDSMTNEEYVQSVWGWVQVRLAEPFEGVAKGKWVVRIPLLPFSQVGFDTEDAAWSAAAEYTFEHMEKVRQLREEIGLLRKQKIHGRTIVQGAILNPHYAYFLKEQVIDLARLCRTLSRLETELTALVQGMKGAA
jgi:hypothetical protein